jgi:Rrf2 family protein
MIKLSTKGRYATRIMVYLALHEDGPPSQKHKIADAEEISPDYVEQILMKLKTAGLVKSHRGVRGGFSLTRNPGHITVADVINATEGPVSLVSCTEEGCKRMSFCVTGPLWEKVNRAIDNILKYTRISDLAAEARMLEKSKGSLSFDI